MAKLKVELLHENSKLPFKPKTDKDAGYDVIGWDVKKIYVHSGGNGESVYDREETITRKFVEPGVLELQCNERCMIGTGIKVTVEDGWEIQVRPRSGLALKQGLTVLNTPGTVDSEYRGELCVIIINTSRQNQRITLGDPIAQIVPKRVEHLEIEVVDKLPDSERGEDGFGSTDAKDFNPPKPKPKTNAPILSKKVSL